ncbi:MAG: hypothetical protein L0216_15800 [Planctomycetales bacterium]|nr:hypothetical protein [Planctomycetales bacterium]
MRELRGDYRDLFLGFRVALDPRKMLLGLAGLLFSLLGVGAILGIGASSGMDGPERDGFTTALQEGRLPDAWAFAARGLDRTFSVPEEHAKRPPPRLVHVKGKGPVRVAPAPRPRPVPDRSSLLSAWDRFCEGVLPRLFPIHRGEHWNAIAALLCVALFFWLVLIWSFFGGAICRIAAVEVAKDERISTREALQFARQKYSSFFWSPVSVFIAFHVFLACNALGGLAGRIPWAGDLLCILAAPLAFLAGFLMLLIAIGGLFGWPLMAPALGAEGTDAFDAVSRAFSYVFSRPWHYLAYAVISKAYALVSIAFVWLFSLLLVLVTFSSVGLGMGGKLHDIAGYVFSFVTFENEAPTLGDLSSAHNPVTAALAAVLGMAVLLVYGLAAGYAISFGYTARTLVYFVLRRKVDATEMNEVYLEEEEDLGGGPLAPPPAPAPATGSPAPAAPGSSPVPPGPAGPTPVGGAPPTGGSEGGHKH